MFADSIAALRSVGALVRNQFKVRERTINAHTAARECACVYRSGLASRTHSPHSVSAARLAVAPSRVCASVSDTRINRNLFSTQLPPTHQVYRRPILPLRSRLSRNRHSHTGVRLANRISLSKFLAVRCSLCLRRFFAHEMESRNEVRRRKKKWFRGDAVKSGCEHSYTINVFSFLYILALSRALIK